VPFLSCFTVLFYCPTVLCPCTAISTVLTEYSTSVTDYSITVQYAPDLHKLGNASAHEAFADIGRSTRSETATCCEEKKILLRSLPDTDPGLLGAADLCAVRELRMLSEGL
jgi:hypothetical protein